MGLSAKAKSSSEEGNRMGFLFVFLPEDDSIINKKKITTFFSSSSSSPSSSSSSPLPFKRTNSSQLISKAQSTISICALLIFITLLLFTLSTFEPTSTSHFIPRRQLSSKSLISNPKITSFSHALQGMGTLYRRGTRAMNDLIVAHLSESVSVHELKLFLRLFHRSGITSRSDLLFIFPSKSASFDSTILEESDSFLNLANTLKNSNSTSSFDATQFLISSKKEKESGEPIWGRRIRSNFSEEEQSESTRLSYGSVVGFEVDELDPENSLSGFLDHVSMNLRRWACYPMLLGRVRRNFKHVMLADVKEMLLLGDPLARVRSKSSESIYLSIVSQSIHSKHGRKNSEKTQSGHQKLVNPAIIMGGARGVRRLSNAMLTEIVRTSMQHKKKNTVSELGLFNQLVGNEHILKNVNLIISGESMPELSQLIALDSRPASSWSNSKFTMVRHGNSHFEVNSTVIAKLTCLSQLDSTVYSDC